MAHHINARNFLCNECPRAYNTGADLAQHQRIHEKQRDPYKCEPCGLFFQIRSKYNTHMRQHQTTTSKGPKECPICNKKFVCLSSHNRTVHLGLRSYECSECGKTFGKKSGLDRHTTTVHHKIRAFKCDIAGCFGEFGEKSQLTKHMSRVHNNREQSYCSFCKQHFGDIKSHFETTHGNLKHICSVCFKRFSKQSSLNTHINVFHTMKRNFFCDYCPNKGFAGRTQLKRHLRKHRERPENDDDDICDHSSVYESDDSHCSIKMEPEQIFVNDLPDVKFFNDTIHEPILDVLVEVKEEILSEDDDIKYEMKKEIAETNNLELKLIDGKDEPDIKQEEDNSELPLISKHKNVNINKSRCKIKLVDFLLDQVRSPDTECCPVCDIEFPKKIEMQNHFDECHRRTESDLSCDKCDKNFGKVDQLKSHYLAVHTEYKFDCQQCDKSFSYKSALDRHVKIVHEDKRDHECLECGRSFGTKYDLALHFKSIHDDSIKSMSRRTCQLCGKIFSKERNLQIHILAIHNDKSFECELCAKKFSFKSAKERHLKVVHYNQRSHQCSHCKKFFGTKYDLRNHIAYNHSSNPQEARKYYCTICERSFTSSSALKRHHKGVHENIKQKGPRDYRCKFCREIFANKYQKEKHIAQVHQDGLKPMRTCRLCNSDFQLCDDFKNHIESHPNAHICLVCGIENADEEALTVHMEDHKHIEMELRRFICDTCGHRLFNKIQLKVNNNFNSW